jgi:hypothetical protein
VGGGLAAVLLALVSGHAGRLAPDPRVVMLMSERDPARLVTTVLVTVAVAPLVEEILFRGVLLETFRARSSRLAVLVSAAAFAAWHLDPRALRYYALMGALLGVVYLRRGLVGSIAAHATFNGVLTVAALAVVLSPATRYAVGGVTLAAPGGWSRVEAGDHTLSLQGPSGAQLLAIALPVAGAPDATTVLDRVLSGSLEPTTGVAVDQATATTTHLPAGDAVSVQASIDGHRCTLVLLSLTDEVVEVLVDPAGSPRARADLPVILSSIRRS